jgi:hypothetical protein
MTKGTETMSQIVSAAAGVWVHLREFALVVAGGRFGQLFPASGKEIARMVSRGDHDGRVCDTVM